MEPGIRGKDSGRGLIGLLVTMVVLAGMGAAVLAYSRDGSGGGHRAALPVSPGTTVSTSPAAAAGGIAAAAAAACRSTVSMVGTAVSYYTTLNGHPPKALADLASLLKDHVTGQGFTLELSPTGQVEVATPAHAASPGSADCAYVS